MPSILITQCLQNDFVKPIGRDEPLPNLLHVGYDEARRLMGDDLEQGPVARTIAWAYGRPAAELAIVHIRDWHDRSDPAQAAHLRQFGDHCLRDTDGARFVFENPPADRAATDIIDSLTLNDFAGSSLGRVFEPFAGRPARVGIVGVWTEAKVGFLAYELTTRYPEFDLAVCSALTASSSRAQHFVALDQMAKILGVRVLTSIGEFADFLIPGTRNIPLPVPDRSIFARVEAEGDLQLGPADQELVQYLFRGCRSVSVRQLSGGFSGNLVLAARSVDAFGHQETPHVLKIGPHQAMGRERAAFERVESVLGNAAPRITEAAERGDRGAIKYRYASMGGGASTTFQKVYGQGAPRDRIEAILRTVFEEQLGTLYAAASRERCDLFAYYAFSPQWAPSVRSTVESLLGRVAEGETIEPGDGLTCGNLCGFYERDLGSLSPGRSDTVSYAWVHGDLNGANIIIDPRGNVWLIDFFHAHRGHVLRDLIKLENDLLYIFTPVHDASDLLAAAVVTRALMEVDDLRRDLPSAEEAGIRGDAFVRAWETVACLRRFYSDLLQTDADPFQLWIGQLRYAAQTLGFEESNEWQKRWALYTAGCAVDRIRARLAVSGHD